MGIELNSIEIKDKKTRKAFEKWLKAAKEYAPTLDFTDYLALDTARLEVLNRKSKWGK